MMNRRDFLGVAGTLLGAPAVVTADTARPQMPSGIQAGEATATRAVIWSRTDRPARMVVQYARNERFTGAQTMRGPIARAGSAFTARIDLGGLDPGEPLFYRVWFESLRDPQATSEPLIGHLRTAPRVARDLTVMWSADTVGQGWGINPDFGGLRLYERMIGHAPDVFVNCGDTIYADNPLLPSVRLPDGTTWHNVVTDAKSRVAETLDDFRGNFAYNLQDVHMRRFNAAVPMLVQWDDHEVMNNWYPGRRIDPHRYHDADVLTIAARARRAMLEFVPYRLDPRSRARLYRAISYGPLLEIVLLDERSYRAANSHNRQDVASADTRMLGPSQLAWAKQTVLRSSATWKIIVSSMPLGVVVGDGQQDGRPVFEAWANGDGPPLGREHEIADLLSFVKRHEIRNIVWITGDVHYAAAHRYDPARAVFREFLPFWEFVAGPLHAGTFGPGRLDPTFGPAVRYQSQQPGAPQNRPPSDGQQFFGTLHVSAGTKRLTVGLFDLAGERVFGIELDP
jgi:alkaline phosphatase D